MVEWQWRKLTSYFRGWVHKMQEMNDTTEHRFERILGTFILEAILRIYILYYICLSHCL